MLIIFMKLLTYLKIIIVLILVSPLFAHSQEREREGPIDVTEVIIKNKDLVDFIRERVFRVVDSLIVPQRPIYAIL